MSAVIVDTVSKFVRTPGSLGDTQGWHAPLAAAPAGCIGMQLALRAYFDRFSFAGPVTPYSRGANSSTAVYSLLGSATWENLFALGLGFTNELPTRNLSDTHSLPTPRGFFGLVTGENSDGNASSFAINVQGTALGAGGITEWCRFGSPVGFVTEQASAILHRQTRAASALNSSYSSVSGLSRGNLDSVPTLTNFDDSGGRWMNTFPANPTDGAKFTIGLEFRIVPGTYQVVLRVFVDTRSIHEDNLIDVFDAYEYVSQSYHINRSNASIDADDAWINDSGQLVLPGFFMHRNGLPGQAFVVKPVKYRYLTP